MIIYAMQFTFEMYVDRRYWTQEIKSEISRNTATIKWSCWIISQLFIYTNCETVNNLKQNMRQLLFDTLKLYKHKMCPIQDKTGMYKLIELNSLRLL